MKNKSLAPSRVFAKVILYLALILISLSFLPVMHHNVVWYTLGVLTILSCLVAYWRLSHVNKTSDAQVLASQNAVFPAISQEIPDWRLQKVIAAANIMGGLGPTADLAETKRTMVEAGRVSLDTDLVALFTIDPCLGMVECENTQGVSAELQQAFLKLYGQHFTDRSQRSAWIVSNASEFDTQDDDTLQILKDAGICSIVACPIRSEASACGALVAFYTTEIEHLEEMGYVIEVFSAQASTALSYALSLEQSKCLLDDLAGANQELSLQATIDGLTGLPNHRTFQQVLADACRKSAGKNGKPFCVVMVDVDHFKIYNDTHGHREGDSVLQKVGKIMTAGLRQGDLAARYGGEEFAMVFLGTTKEAAYAAAERVRRAIAEQSFRRGSVTVSMGVAEFPLDASTSGELIECADKALYHAKVTGRNRVYAWGTMAMRASEMQCDLEETRDSAVIIVEDKDDIDAQALEATLSHHFNVLQITYSVTEASELLKTRVFDIALVSLDALPNQHTRSLSTLSSIHPQMPIVLIASDISTKESKDALRRGATDILVKPYNVEELPIVIERTMERQRLELQRLMQKSTGVMLQAIEALVAAIDAKDHYTAGHSQKVASISLSLCDGLNISNEERYALELAAKLHDIGKLALPDSALNKQSPLTDEEWQAMRQHPAIGAKIVGAISELAYVSTLIRHHHERLDGTGYPDGLTGPAIPYLSRIIAVADAYEAMTSERSYRGRLNAAEAVRELRLHSGTQYEPEILDILEKQLRTRGDISEKEITDKAA